ncbi:phosphatase PAP2 family protein [Companilactobacillus mishanensis]|uniref:phosphatase PAP2 family protein n=1 Tax=Companilactobacillus mishanensis TaxID=2486008 RepID=UPI000F777411|nr:phosphatase PAP2 family protein [Companilactobacillus mishanensis]
MKLSKVLYYLNSLLLVVFVIWTISVANHATFISQFDNYWISAIYHHSNASLFTLTTFTEIGGTVSTIIITIVMVILLCYFKYYYSAMFLAFTKIAVVIVNTIIKYWIRRPRPSHHHYVLESGFSYPSGHSSSALSLYVPLLIISIYIFRKISLKILIGIATSLLFIIIGYSRVFLGVHYPSDIIGGYLLAATVVSIIYTLFRSKDPVIFNLKGIKDKSNN